MPVTDLGMYHPDEGPEERAARREAARKAELIAQQKMVEEQWKARKATQEKLEATDDLGLPKHRDRTVQRSNDGLMVGAVGVDKDGKYVFHDKMMDDDFWRGPDDNYGERAAIEDRRQWRAGW